MIQNATKKPMGFDKELLLVGEGYVARPVTVAKSTIAGLQPNDAGKYIIPAGTYLYGSTGESLLANPQQIAVAVVPTSAHATVTIGTKLVVEAKAEGDLAYNIALVAGTKRNPSIAVSGTGSAKVVTVTLGVDKAGAVTTTYGDVVTLINGDAEANTYVVASLAEGVDADTVAVAGEGTTAGGGAETVASNIDGILYHSVDVTDGEATGAMIIHAYINVDNMPSVPGEAVKAKLPHIVFARKD